MARPDFKGLRVLGLESRRATELSTLISTFGGQPTVAPALREVPLESNHEALAFGSALLEGRFDVVIFLTGVGTRVLVSVIERVHSRAALVTALSKTKVVARGPKPLAVLRELQVPVWVTAPEPNTWRELVAAIDARAGELGGHPRIAVQEYGVSNPELLTALRDRGASITQVPVYQWALPEDTEPLKQAVAMIARGDIDVVLFTTGVQIAHLLQIARSMQLDAAVIDALSRTVVVSIGPTTSEELRRQGLSVDLEPSHPKMGVLVTEAAERSAQLLAAKRREKRML
jgi:uroporphyrinogen-III synthase